MNVFGAAPVDEAGEGVRSAGFRLALRRAALLVALAISAAAATQGVLSALPSGAEVRASLAIDRKGVAESVVDTAFLDAQAKLIASRDTLRRAATELGVTDAAAFSKPPLQARVLAALGLGGASKLTSPEERLTDALAARFSAAPSGRGRAIDVRFSADNADFAIRFVDRVVADYLVLQGTDGGVGARLVSGAAPVEQVAGFTPSAGAALAGLSVLALGGVAAAAGRWRRREMAEPPEEAPLAVGALEPCDPIPADDEAPPPAESTDWLPVTAPVPPVALPGVDLAGRRRVAVACFGEGDENRRLVDELARDGGFSGARIVVVDASRRASDQPGLAELLAGEADFADVIQRNAASRAHEIGAGRRPLAALADDTEAAAMLLEALEQTYDLVLIDLGRLRADPAFTLFARLAGQLMLTGDADRGAVDTLLAALGRKGVTGIVRVATTAGDIAA
ncbi:hypothetical protein KL86PLE_110103 [uncultured Pleomorphomonas sp.]|uniref:Polysaccharide chain length determinant N-terminal domain-containing protein n=1 Tax=uncultured Pleomorphomonas sp. TaxID=442121 RepID=A0A212L7S3_9HYPH|nr:hypothetical protein [uncultured Pleomorphomonas sp.]SCM73527.1 hypothetical protein KL86PLE_110103 [uncultured Pleomorphomonas sp.]